MKLILETPVLRFATKKFAEAVQDLDAKISDSPILATLFGVEKKNVIDLPFSQFHKRDIRPFLNKELIKKSVALSMKYEAARRARSPFARDAYIDNEGALEEAAQKYKNSINPSVSAIKKNMVWPLEAKTV